MTFSLPKGTKKNLPVAMQFADPVEVPAESPIKVLAIHKDENAARFSRQILSNTRDVSFQLVVVNRLDEAMKRIENESFDAVVLDTDLPDSRGLEAVCRFRKYARELPIVVLGPDDDTHLAIESVRLGAEDYLSKPETDCRTLIRTIRLGIERNRMHQIHALTRLLENLEYMPSEDTNRAAAGA